MTDKNNWLKLTLSNQTLSSNIIHLLLGLSSFYSELMKGAGASGRLWELLDRQPLIPRSGLIIKCQKRLGTGSMQGTL